MAIGDSGLRYDGDALMTFDFRAFMNLYKAEKESKKPNLVYSAIWQFDERFGRIKRAMRKAPLEYIGQNNHPSNPEYQKRRAISNKLVEMIIK